MYPQVIQFETRMRELRAEAELARQVAAVRPARPRPRLFARFRGRSRHVDAPGCPA